MAKGSAIIGKIKGHAGNLVFRVRKGEQVIQTKPGPRGKDHLPTYNQAWNYMRFKWASLMSQVTLELTDHSFTRKYMNQSSTNKFIQANIQNFNPINKKCQNIFDLNVEAPLTFNGIQISSGDMAPVNIVLGAGSNVGDFGITRDQSTNDIKLLLTAFQKTGSTEQTYATFADLLKEEGMMTEVSTWINSHNIKPGEMLTIVIMLAKGYTQYGSWSNENDLPYGLNMVYIRFKLNDDGTTIVVQPSESFLNELIEIKKTSTSKRIEFNFGENSIVGAALIHSKEVYGGWECDDTFMQAIDPIKNTWRENFTWKQSAVTLYQNDWSTQDMPILDPASLTRENQQTLETGRVINTVNANNQKVFVGKVTEEVTVSGEDLEVSEKTTKKRSSKTSDEE